jgi:hypothetical protein
MFTLVFSGARPKYYPAGLPALQLCVSDETTAAGLLVALLGGLVASAHPSKTG